MKFGDRLDIIKFGLVTTTSYGMLYNNVVFGTVGTYPLSLPLIFTIIFYLLSVPEWFSSTAKIRSPFFLLIIVLLNYQFIVHGWVNEGIYNIEWLRSFSLLILYSGILIISGPIYLTESALFAMARLIVWGGLVMGFAGIVQFALTNTVGVQPIILPEVISLRVVDLQHDSLRFGGITRATGYAYEPSFYGTGMVVIATLYLMLWDWFPDVISSIRMSRIAGIATFGGVIASLSLAAWGVFAVIFGLYQASRLQPKQVARGIVIGCLMLTLLAPLTPRIATRWTEGNDYSMIHRVWSSFELIVGPGETLTSSIIGTGIGLDLTSAKVWNIFLRNLDANYIRYINENDLTLNIVNGFSYIAVSTGWIGLVINTLLIFAVFRFSFKAVRKNLYVLALITGYFFTNARYLWPEWWFLLLLIMCLYDLKRRNLAESENLANNADGVDHQNLSRDLSRHPVPLY